MGCSTMSRLRPSGTPLSSDAARGWTLKGVHGAGRVLCWMVGSSLYSAESCCFTMSVQSRSGGLVF
jgi:hypothetical protein